MDAEVLKRLEEEDSSDKVCPINICEIITYGFENNHISIEDDNLNVISFNEAIKKKPKWEDYQIPIGYEIFNASTDTIKDIEVPKYTWNANTKRYEGEIVKTSLPPQETMSLPTEWLMILLMKLGTGLKIHNGEMKRICKLKTDDLDAQLRNFYFEPDEIDYKVFENPLSYKMIGAYEILGPDKISEDLVIPDAHYQEIFAYLMNMDDKQIADNKISANVEFLKKVIFSK